jgi:transcriptional regulator with XRE-family HTH domain
LRAYTLVIKELKRSGITQAELARRLGKAPEIISRLLSRPTNLELKTLSELLFAISGSVLTLSTSRPLDGVESAASFYRTPHHPVVLRREDVSPLEAETRLRAMSRPYNVQIRNSGIGVPSEVAAAA